MEFCVVVSYETSEIEECPNRAQRRAPAAKKRGKKNPYRRELCAEVAVTSLTLIWLPELSRQLGRSKFTIKRWIRERRFPPPLKITEQGCAWRVRDVEAWLDKMARSRRKITYRGVVANQMQREARDAS